MSHHRGFKIEIWQQTIIPSLPLFHWQAYNKKEDVTLESISVASAKDAEADARNAIDEHFGKN